MTKFKVRDGTTRVIEFDGDLLAEVSSERSGSPRWSEIRLYRTGSGIFVLEKLGASVVIHAPGCPEILRGQELPRFQAEYPGQDPADDQWWWCETCEDVAEETPMHALLVEANRYWTITSETPDEIIDALYRRKGGAKMMPRMSLELLDEAAKVSPELAAAYGTEVLA